jgi:hypothetical protein
MEGAVARALEFAGAALFAPLAKGAGFGPCPLKNPLERRVGQTLTLKFRGSELPAPT